jgi:lipoate-protein ligase A
VTEAGHDPVQGPWDLDADLIAAARQDGRPRCAVYPHPGLVAVIGRGGDPWVETRPDLLARDDVPLRRRRGGGCAVVLDPGNLVCSVALPRPGVGGITGAFAELSEVMIATLRSVGIGGVRQEGVSDLAVGERKLGGSCIWRTRGLVYYSTTVLVDPDWDAIDRYLPHPPREPDYRRGRPHRDFLTSCSELGRTEPAEALASRMSVILTDLVASILMNKP